MAADPSQPPPSKKPPPLRPPLKIYLSKVNTYLGQAIVKEFTGAPLSPGDTYYGSVSEHKEYPVLPAIKEAWKEEESMDFCRRLQSCDVMIWDLDNCNHGVLEFALKAIKMRDEWRKADSKTLILVSSIYAWTNTYMGKKKDAEEGKSEGEQAEGDAGKEEEPVEEDDKEEPDPELDDLTGEKPPAENAGEEAKIDETEEAKKKAAAAQASMKKYQRSKAFPTSHKYLETLAMSLTDPKLDKNAIKVYVICAGVLYGNEENLLYEYFKRAWLQFPERLPYVGKGDNVIPTIHAVDLARLIKRLIRVKPPLRYIVAVDRSKKNTQKKIVAAIAKAVGTAKIGSVKEEELSKNPWMVPLQINLRLKPSEAFNDEPAPEGEGELDQEEQEKRAKARQFPWHCEQGIVENIVKLNLEFNNGRDLKPVKIFVSAPPASGKSAFCQILAKYYNVPHIRRADLEELAKGLKTDLGQEIQKKMEEDKEKKMEEYEKLPKKVKKTIDMSKYEPIIPDDLLCKVLQIKLNSNICRNRGYVLDDFPQNYKLAQQAFLKLPKTEGDQEAQQEEGGEVNYENYVLSTEIAPSSAVILTASDAFIIDKVKNMTEEEQQSKAEHQVYNEVEIKKRLKLYRSENYAEDGSFSIMDFFKQRSIDILTVSIETNTEKEKNLVIKQIKAFVERNGKPKNYMTEDEDLEKIRLKKVSEEAKLHDKSDKQQKEREEQLEASLREQKKEIDQRRVKKLIEQEKQLLECKAEPIKDYINKSIGGILAEGIAQVCKQRPADPVEFLAQYLFKRSLDVKENGFVTGFGKDAGAPHK